MKDGSTLEYVFEAGEQSPPDAVTKEKAAEIAADFMTTFYHVQVGALETHGISDNARSILADLLLMGLAALLATVLHGIEAATWGAAYLLLGALPDAKSAMLYSLSAMTSYGHANLFLEQQWQLMGALEALNGCFCSG